MYVQYEKGTRNSHVSILKRLPLWDISCGTWEAILKCNKSEIELDTKTFPRLKLPSQGRKPTDNM